jgi:hypothetical protein
MVVEASRVLQGQWSKYLEEKTTSFLIHARFIIAETPLGKMKQIQIKQTKIHRLTREKHINVLK